MNLPWKHQKPPYTLAELDGQLGATIRLEQLRDAAAQKATVYRSDERKCAVYEAQASSYDEAIRIATEVYKHMAQELADYNKQQVGK